MKVFDEILEHICHYFPKHFFVVLDYLSSYLCNVYKLQHLCRCNLREEKNLSYMFFHLSIVKVESKLSNNFPCLVSQIQLSLYGEVLSHY